MLYIKPQICKNIFFPIDGVLSFGLMVSEVAGLVAREGTSRRRELLRREDGSQAWSAQRHVLIGARRLITKSHVCSSATNVATNAFVFPQAHMDIRTSVHATTTGKPREELPNAHKLCFDIV
ncbi:hypothetical protein L484_021620 [Morus notabilis]|uniref:Uncharacterized protein n=1 Tax=Morus notabilis TaxID=981085 RepID=W9SM78_9ROSA|nr:hypothetical protein L484_021620 [Morus notabilis]